MEVQNKKRKLTVEEQIQDMINKNIKFELCSQEEVKNFLKYYNLDFAYLVELSKLDLSLLNKKVH